jgi:hypothetical protein
MCVPCLTYRPIVSSAWVRTPYMPSSNTVIEGREFVIPVVGGSGKYFGARGELHSVNLGKGTIEHTVYLAR